MKLSVVIVESPCVQGANEKMYSERDERVDEKFRKLLKKTLLPILLSTHVQSRVLNRRMVGT